MKMPPEWQTSREVWQFGDFHRHHRNGGLLAFIYNSRVKLSLNFTKTPENEADAAEPAR
jgi:hypothetical protein